MSTVTVVEETISGVRGVRFMTDARQDTPQDEQLQELQARLGGVRFPPPGTTLPQLSLVSVAIPGGGSYAAITLWVPEEQRSEAERGLEAAGFEVPPTD